MIYSCTFLPTAIVASMCVVSNIHFSSRVANVLLWNISGAEIICTPFMHQLERKYHSLFATACELVVLRFILRLLSFANNMRYVCIYGSATYCHIIIITIRKIARILPFDLNPFSPLMWAHRWMYFESTKRSKFDLSSRTNYPTVWHLLVLSGGDTARWAACNYTENNLIVLNSFEYVGEINKYPRTSLVCKPYKHRAHKISDTHTPTHMQSIHFNMYERNEEINKKLWKSFI